MLLGLLAHPLTRGLDIDSPATTHLRRKIIQEKGFLRKIYEEWYEALAARIPQGVGLVVELGSGPGFFSDHVPEAITSDVLAIPGVAQVVDAHQLPFDNDSLRAIAMINVLHHLPKPRQFLRSAARCVRPGGVIVMVEPWNTPWSRFIYRRFHHEPFDMHAPAWEFSASGPLTGANGALPWIVFQRDRARFELEFPQWRIESILPGMPFRYLLSGGVSLRALMPATMFGLWGRLERCLRPWMSTWAMFAEIQLRRTHHRAATEGKQDEMQ